MYSKSFIFLEIFPICCSLYYIYILTTSGTQLPSWNLPSSSFWTFPLPLPCDNLVFLASHNFLSFLFFHFLILVEIPGKGYMTGKFF